jgi:hypothetical protein
MDTPEQPSTETISSISATQARGTTELARAMMPEHMQSVYNYIHSRASEGYDYIQPKALESMLKLNGSPVRVKNILSGILGQLKSDGYKVSKTKISW